MFLELKDLTMKFGGLTAVDRINLQIERGSIHGLIGPNGSGKTTTFNMISGYYKPTSGQIVFEGKEISGKPTFQITRLGFARTFQNLRLFHSMNVLNNILVSMEHLARLKLPDQMFNPFSVRREENDFIEKGRQILELMQIGEYENEPATSLPYGLQRRVELARALATEPQILLLDEPAAGLSTTEADTLMDIIFQIREQGVTIFLVEHHMRVVMNVCEQITVLDHGRKIAEGNPKAVSSNEKVIEAYLGQEKEMEKC
ncbi:MAG: ABC transporter ATP-binding protein [Anaerolineales bacterium]|nr:ABC transporter ATP-binding protein [Anaerolineales bacterium]